MPHPPEQPSETPKAAAAFAGYVALGPSRSLRKLAAELVAQNRYKTATTALNSLRDWSVKYRWQERIAEVASRHAREMLEQAEELDAETFLLTSRQINDRITVSCPVDTRSLISLRETVRRPQPKGATTVDVGVTVSLSVQQQEILQRVAERRGVSVDDLLARTERLTRGDC